MVLPLQIQYMKQSKSDKLQRHHYIDFSLHSHGHGIGFGAKNTPCFRDIAKIKYSFFL